MGNLIFLAITIMLMIGMFAFIGIRHLRDVASTLAMVPDGDRLRSVRKRRQRLLLLCTVPIFLLAALIHDPWNRSDRIDKLDEGIASVSFAGPSLTTIPEANWQEATPRALRAFRFQPSSLVLRVKVPREAAANRYVAEIPYMFLQEVEFLLVEGNREVGRSLAGMNHQMTFNNHRGMHYSFDYQADDKSDRVLFVRIIGEGLMLGSINLFTEEQFQEATFYRSVAIALTVGAFLGIMLYNLALVVSLRHRVYVYYLFYQCLMFGFMMIYSGLASTMMPQLSHGNFFTLSYAMYEILLLITIAMSYFYSEFLSLRENFPWMFRAMRLACLVPALMMPAILCISLGSAGVLTLTYVALILTANTIYFLPLVSYRHVQLYILAFVGLGAGTIIHSLGNVGIWPTSWVVDFMYGFGTVWEMLFLSMAIGDKISSMKADGQTIQQTIREGGPLSGLNQVLGQSFAQNFVPRQWHVSIAFIRIVNFSRLVDITPADRLYALLAEELKVITMIVRRHGGLVDRSLGDGILCYFGYQSASRAANHATNAYRAAREIQLRSIERFATRTDDEAVLFPLSIGINSADVLVANLSSGGTNDVTMIGSGVNLASRLNTACSPFRILVSESFHEAISRSGEPIAEISEIYVSIKHHKDLMRAFECTPAYGSSERLNAAERAFVGLMGYGRKEGRLRVTDAKSIQVRGSLGIYTLTDFSLDGLGLVGNLMISQQSVLSLEILGEASAAMDVLQRSMLQNVQVEVRWCRPSRGRFEHGLKYIGLSSTQKEVIFNYFTAVFAEHRVIQDATTDQAQEDAS